MSLFDQVYIENEIIVKYNIRCLNCQKLMFNTVFQSKTIDDDGGCMEDYYLTQQYGKVFLKKLLKPSNKQFWHEFTQEEIDKWNDQDDWLTEIFPRKKGDGRWKKEAFLVENRIKEDMGEFPHKYIIIYTNCNNCYKMNQKYIGVEYKIKFTDGIVQKVETIK